MRLDAFDSARFALFGLGGSGLSTARALVAAGAAVTAFDDNPDQVAHADEEGVPVGDLRALDWTDLDGLILAPGVPLTHPKPHWSVALAHEANVPVIGDIDLFFRQVRSHPAEVKTVAITGTNGKSTTTALIAHMLTHAGRDVVMGGNIWTPVIDLADPREGLHYVLECSSYQIDLAPALAPEVGILLNLTPDHLDRHGTMEHYASVKERLIAGVTPGGTAIVGIDDTWCQAIAARAGAKGTQTVSISGGTTESAGIFARGTAIVDARNDPPVEITNLADSVALRGPHNAQNAAAATAAGLALGLTVAEIADALLSFPGLAHRMEPVGLLHGVPVINDSKATNADAAAFALQSFETVYWIAGGVPKAGGIDSLKEFFPKIVKAYLIGEAADHFSETLGAVPHVVAGTLDEAVAAAGCDLVAANPGSVLLLSPACASFDQYRNFEVRGDRFKALVKALEGFED